MVVLAEAVRPAEDPSPAALVVAGHTEGVEDHLAGHRLQLVACPMLVERPEEVRTDHDGHLGPQVARLQGLEAEPNPVVVRLDGRRERAGQQGDGPALRRERPRA